MTDSAPSASTPFHDLDAYVALPRGAGLTLSPDGSRLVTAVQTLNPKRTKWVTALWEVDPAGERPARRLTRSAKGEGGAAFLPDGSLLFTSARPDPASDDDEEVALLWLLPGRWRRGARRGHPARRRGPRRGRLRRRHRRPRVGDVPVVLDRPSAEAAKRKARKDQKVSAILHEQVPVRFWDHDLGPDAPRLFAGTLTDEGSDAPDRADAT